MYLKLEIDGEESFHSFPDKKRVAIGRAPTCDIQVVAEGISRHHLEIHEKLEGEFYAIDKGSTHGTFINDKQLKKDKPVSFNTFFPAKMGANVHIYLMDEPVSAEPETPKEPQKSSLDSFFEENPDRLNVAEKESSKESTKKKSKKPQIHVPTTAGKMTKDMEKLLNKEKASQASSRVSKKKKVTRKKASAREPKSNKNKRKSDSNRKLLTIIAVIGALAFIGYKQWQKIEKQKIITQRELLAKKKALERQKAKEEAERLAREKELQKQKEQQRKADLVKGMIVRDKCLFEEEKILCEQMKKTVTRMFREGAVKELSTMYFIFDVRSSKVIFNNVDYTEEEKEKVYRFALTKQGRRFHEGRFSIRQNYRLDELEITPKVAQAYALADFIVTFHKEFNIPNEIEKVVVMAIDGDNYLSHITINSEKLKQTNLTDYYLEAKTLIRSNIDTQMYKIIKELSSEI